MAPIKFEEQIKEKLESRNIIPSDAVWSQLSDKLDSEQKKNNSRRIWWLGIAASVAALVMISVTYFNSGIENNSEPVIVNEDSMIEEALPNNTYVQPKIEQEVVVEDIPEVKENQEGLIPIKESKKPFVKTNEIQKATQNSAIAEVKIEEPLINTVKEQKETDILIDKSAINNAVAEIVKFQSNTDTKVTDAQIDSLLKSAQREILKNRIFKEGSNVVDANALLQDVEDDLGQSFRTKVFEALKDSYTKVKTAVAERNN